MKRLNVLIVVLACSLASSAQVLNGVVQNGTTNKPAAGEEVTLNQPGQNGMQEVGKVLVMDLMRKSKEPEAPAAGVPQPNGEAKAE